MSVTLLAPAVTAQEEPEVIHLLLRMRPALTREVLELTLDELAMIADTYRDWAKQDLLSAKILEWCLEMLTLDVPHEQYVETFLAKLKILSDSVLVNSFDLAPLSNPRVVDNVVWDEWMLQDISGGPSSPHALATEIIRWRNALPIALEAPNKPVLQRDLHQQNRTVADQKAKAIFYKAMTVQIKARNELQHLQLMMDEDAACLQKLWEEARRAIADGVQDLDNALAKLVLAQKQEVDAHKQQTEIFKLHAGALQADLNLCEKEALRLKDLVERLKVRLIEAEKRVTTAEKSNAIHAEQIRQLRQLFAAQQAQVAQMANAGKGSKKCIIA